MHKALHGTPGAQGPLRRQRLRSVVTAREATVVELRQAHQDETFKQEMGSENLFVNAS